MAAWLGCVPRTEQGAKLEFCKRSFSGWWSVPAEGIEPGFKVTFGQLGSQADSGKLAEENGIASCAEHLQIWKF